MTLKELDKYSKPREKLLKYGPERLSDEELLAIIIGSGTRGKNVLQLSREILEKFKSREFGYECIDDLRKIEGIGLVKACEIISCFEIGKRYFASKKHSVYLTPRDVYENLFEYRYARKEHFIVVYLDVKNQEIKKQIVSIGTVNFSVVHPRDVFEEAVKNLASSIIVVHNHPSGILEPSQEDIKLTHRIVEAGKLLGIEVVDHVIIGKNGYYSFKENSLI